METGKGKERKRVPATEQVRKNVKYRKVQVFEKIGDG